MGILEKIQEIEREIARTQKNKATEYHLGLLKAKLAKYRVRFLIYFYFGYQLVGFYCDVNNFYHKNHDVLCSATEIC